MLNALAITAALSSIITPVAAETVLGVAVFSRHGDRNSKHYKGYRLTNLGYQQNFQVGSDFRSRYVATNAPQRILGIASDQYAPAQVYASAPDQQVLLNTATAFLQGLYPPLDSVNPQSATQRLNNGTTLTAPLSGYQYVVLHGSEDASPSTIWIKGDEQCPTADKAQKAFFQSAAFKATDAATKAFYAKFWDLLAPVYDYKENNMTFTNAYDIYDLINTASTQNSTFRAPSQEDMFQLRTLADSAEFNTNFNTSQPLRATGAQTLSAAMLTQLREMVSSKGKLKFSLLAGSYDTFLAFFGLTGLTNVSPDFYGLPHYASAIAFEILSTNNVTAFPSTQDLSVRFLFRNGTETGSQLRPFPLFGLNREVLPWADFEREMSQRSIASVEQWCSVCESKASFCSTLSASGSSASGKSSGSGGVSKPVAGVIGAVVTLAVVALLGGLFFLVMRRRRSAAAAGAAAPERKTSLHTDSGSDTKV